MLFSPIRIFHYECKKIPTIPLRRRDIFTIISLIVIALVRSLKKYLPHCYLQPFILLFLRSRKEITLSKRVIDCRPIGAQFKSSNDSLSSSLSADKKEIRQYKSRLSRHCSATIMRLFVIPAPTDQIFLISWILPA